MVANSAFMTQADVPLLAVENLIENPVNPFTQIPLKADKAEGVDVATSSALQYTIAADQWLHIHDDIFNRENWTRKDE
jgi:hypothetical protein